MKTADALGNFWEILRCDRYFLLDLSADLDREMFTKVRFSQGKYKPKVKALFGWYITSPHLGIQAKDWSYRSYIGRPTMITWNMGEEGLFVNLAVSVTIISFSIRWPENFFVFQVNYSKTFIILSGMFL